MVKVADPILMREINKYHVLETIRRHGKISRVEISKHTFLSATTVSAITSALIEEGLIAAIHTKPSRDAPRGRPRVFLDLIPDAAYVVGIMIAVGRTTTTLINFKGEAIASMQIPVRIFSWELDTIVDLIEGSVREIVSQEGIDLEKIKGIGIGVPGVVNPTSGFSHSSPVFGVRDMPIVDVLEERMQIKVRIEKPSSLVALAESWFGLARDDDCFAVVALDDTVSLSVMLGGDLHRGASGLGPTFAHITSGSEGRICACGQHDCLNTYASTSALVEKWNAQENTQLDLSKASNAKVIEAICTAARAGNAHASELLREQGVALGVAVSHVVNIVNPTKIIVGVQLAAHQEAVEEAFRQSVEQNSFEPHFKSTEIFFDIFDEKLWASGAAALVLKDIYSAPWTVERPLQSGKIK